MKKRFCGLFIVVVLCIAMAFTGCVSVSDSSDSSSSGTVENKSATVTYEQVDLKTMMDDLKSNALKAEKNYMDKNVEVVGKIASFDSDGSYISIEPVNADEWNFDTVTCNVENDAQLDILLEKSVGDQVTIKGQVVSVGEVFGYTIDIAEVN